MFPFVLPGMLAMACINCAVNRCIFSLMAHSGLSKAEGKDTKGRRQKAGDLCVMFGLKFHVDSSFLKQWGVQGKRCSLPSSM